VWQYTGTLNLLADSYSAAWLMSSTMVVLGPNNALQWSTLKWTSLPTSSWIFLTISFFVHAKGARLPIPQISYPQHLQPHLSLKGDIKLCNHNISRSPYISFVITKTTLKDIFKTFVVGVNLTSLTIMVMPPELEQKSLLSCPNHVWNSSAHASWIDLVCVCVCVNHMEVEECNLSFIKKSGIFCREWRV
jgi:hypothetical protein